MPRGPRQLETRPPTPKAGDGLAVRSVIGAQLTRPALDTGPHRQELGSRPRCTNLGTHTPRRKRSCTPHRRTPSSDEKSILFLFKHKALRASQPMDTGRGPEPLGGTQVTQRGVPDFQRCASQ